MAHLSGRQLRRNDGPQRYDASGAYLLHSQGDDATDRVGGLRPTRTRTRRVAVVKYIDVVLTDAKQRAWEGLSDEQRETYLKAATAATGVKQPMSIIRRWAVQTGPKGDLR